jgi:AraC-like DNA-binding protein/ketosteroid isomerase-like protein
MIGIRFHPHTAGQLLKLPMCELTDAAVSVDDISGRLFRELQELEELRPPLKRFAALDRIVLALGKRAGGDDGLLSAAVTELEAAGGSIGVGGSVGVVADHAGLSARQFERRFRQAVGISPKLFSRMQRFQRVFPALESANVGWADAAVRCGYYDQAHLIRDFREFAGKPPAALVAEDTDLAKHFCAMRAHVAFFQDMRGHFSLNCGEVVKGEAMKNSGLSRGVLLVLLAVGLGPAQQAQPAQTLQEEVVAQERAGLDALKIGDLTAFANSLPDDAVFVDAHGAAGKEEVVKNVAGFRLTEFTMTDVRFVALSADSGLIVYRLAESGTSHGKEFAAKVHVSSLWLRRGGRWMCVFSQETAAK